MLKLTLLWLIGEMVNTSPSQGDIHGFESRTNHQMTKTAQSSSFFILKLKAPSNDDARFLTISYSRTLDIRRFHSAQYRIMDSGQLTYLLHTLGLQHLRQM